MKKDLDISRPRYSEQTLPVRPLTLRYVEVLQLYLNWQTWDPRRAYPPPPIPPPPHHHHHPALSISALFYGYWKLHEKGKKGGIWGQIWGSNSGPPAQEASQESFKEGGGSSDGWRLRFSNFDGWRLNFVAFYGWRLSSWNYSISYSKY